MYSRRYANLAGITYGMRSNGNVLETILKDRFNSDAGAPTGRRGLSRHFWRQERFRSKANTPARRGHSPLRPGAFLSTDDRLGPDETRANLTEAGARRSGVGMEAAGTN